MEYLILGLLILSPMTGYELQQFIKKNLALICSHSAGSVQTALAKLEKGGKITVSETSEGRRLKKIFSITDSGRSTFANWISQPMQADKIKIWSYPVYFCRSGKTRGTPCRHPRLYPANRRYQVCTLSHPGLS